MPGQIRSSLKTTIATDQRRLRRSLVRRQTIVAPARFLAKFVRVRSLIIQAKCGTFAATDLSLSLLHEKGEAMKKTLMALGAVATLAVSAVAAPLPPQAQRGVAAGVAAGLIGGAIVGGAIASQNGYYGAGLLRPGLRLLRRPGLCRRARLPAASGSGSGSGTAMAGGSAASGSATESPFIFITNLRRRPGNTAFPGRLPLTA